MPMNWKAFFRDGLMRIDFGLSRKAPAVWSALGALVAFYPCDSTGIGSDSLPQRWACCIMVAAFILAGFSMGIQAFSVHRQWRTRAGLAFALGLALGLGAALTESATVAPAEITRFETSGFSGVLLSDSRVSASGNTVMLLRLSSIELAGPGWKARLEWPKNSARAQLVGQGRQAYSKGMKISALKVSSIDVSQALFYAGAKDMVPAGFSSSIFKIRSRAVRYLSQRLERVSGKAFPLAQALILGIRDELDPEIPSLFRTAGCAHILALSGQHLSILCALVSLFFTKVLRRHDLAKAAVPVIAILFTWLAGAGPSLLRAALMSLLGAASSRLDRPQEGIAILGIAFCIALGLSPPDARSLSFSLSYGAMLGLFLLSARWENFLWRLPVIVAKPLAASLAALCATAFISLPSFGYLALGGIAASVLAGPLVLVLMWLILGAIILGSIAPFLDGFFALLHESLQKLLLIVMEMGSRLPTLRPGEGTKALPVLAAIAILSLFVYAYPHIEYAASVVRPGKNPTLKPQNREKPKRECNQEGHDHSL